MSLASEAGPRSPERVAAAAGREGGEDCASATVITGIPYSDVGSTAGHVNDYDGFDGAVCPSRSTSPDVVYRYTPAVDEDVTIELCNSAYDTKLYVFEGTCGNLTACDDDGCSALEFRSVLNCLHLKGGVDYYFVVDGWGGESGDYELNVTPASLPTIAAGPTCGSVDSFTQSPAGPSGTWNAGNSDERFGMRRFDRYATNDALLCTVRWWGLNAYFNGSSWFGCGRTPDNYRIAFYEDAGGRPGALACSFEVSPQKANAGLSYSGFTLYRYTADLPTCCDLAGGWISIEGVDAGQDCWFLWMGSDYACAASLQDSGHGPLPDTYNLSLCLDGYPHGGCCLPDGACAEDQSAAACRSAGGRPLPLETPCSGDFNGDTIDDSCACATFGDFNCDDCIDVNDYPSFEACLSGPGSPADPRCGYANYYSDLTINLRDFQQFQLLQGFPACIPGPGACALADGSCVVTAGMTPCTSLGGAYIAEGTTCDDLDGDRIPDAFESGGCAIDRALSRTGTDPLLADTDGDGILDGDEVYGTLGGLDLPALGADPCRKDIFVEVDWHDDSHEDALVHSHRPTPAAVAAITAAFANAPEGLALHVDYGQGGAFTGGNLLPGSPEFVAFPGDFAALKAVNFAANRLGYFHYAIFSHAYDFPGNGSSGIAEFLGDDFMVTLGLNTGSSATSKTFMHELGHNLGLDHGGFEPLNYKPNYNSVMNYRFQFSGVDSGDCNAAGNGILDYSSGNRVTLNEAALSEQAGVCGSVAINWNGGTISPSPVARNINCAAGSSTACGGGSSACWDSTCDVLSDYDDWGNLNFSTLTRGDRGDMRIITCQDAPPAP